MRNIKIYTTTTCPYCIKAKKLLKAKGIEFEEINIEDNESFILNKLAEKSGIHTVPQIYVDEELDKVQPKNSYYSFVGIGKTKTSPSLYDVGASLDKVPPFNS